MLSWCEWAVKLLRPIAPQTVVIGEVGLAGDVRPVALMDRRVMEASKLGFTTILVPKMANGNLKVNNNGKSKLVPVANLSEAITAVLGTVQPHRK